MTGVVSVIQETGVKSGAGVFTGEVGVSHDSGEGTRVHCVPCPLLQHVINTTF